MSRANRKLRSCDRSLLGVAWRGILCGMISCLVTRLPDSGPAVHAERQSVPLGYPALRDY